MRQHETKIEGRVSFGLRALVEQGGELNASLRALLIIGGAACGLDLTDVRAEIPDLISSRLQPAVREGLFALISGNNGQRLLVPHTETSEEDFPMDDELLGDADGAGFDV